MIGEMSLDKDGVRAAVVFAEMANYLAKKNMTALQQLEEIHKRFYTFLFAVDSIRYGYFASCNRYFFCYDPKLMETIFNRIRANGAYKKACGRFPIKHIRDLTVGYDTQQPGNKPILPVSSGTQMITFFFENGCVATLRGSGTEPKLKYCFNLCSSIF